MSVVLHVEDNFAHAMLFSRSMGGLPVTCRITHVADGQAALDYLNQRNKFSDPQSAPRPTIILLDLHLPKLSGFDVLSGIKENPLLRDIPVIILTTSDSEADKRKALNGHANGYITKPADYTSFTKMVESLAGDWLN